MSAITEDRQFNILLVEDDPINIRVMIECLDQNHYQLFIAKTREKAMQIIRNAHIDIVLLDINLPDGNGFEICKELVDNKHVYGNLNVVFMTGMDRPEDETRGIELGALDYITKPINGALFRARLQLQAKLIRRTELLSSFARIDGTTELNNRRAFDDQLEKEWGRALRNTKPISLCLIDIDFFKQYNDTYGHPAGDQCLKLLAKTLKQKFKRSSDFIARYGGEEFAIIMYDTTGERAYSLVRDALTFFQALEVEHSSSRVSKYVSFSSGVCEAHPNEDLTPSQLVEATDKVLYCAKNDGRARVYLETLKT